jgi:hypothetical protein
VYSSLSLYGCKRAGGLHRRQKMEPYIDKMCSPNKLPISFPQPDMTSLATVAFSPPRKPDSLRAHAHAHLTCSAASVTTFVVVLLNSLRAQAGGPKHWLRTSNECVLIVHGAGGARGSFPTTTRIASGSLPHSLATKVTVGLCAQKAGTPIYTGTVHLTAQAFPSLSSKEEASRSIADHESASYPGLASSIISAGYRCRSPLSMDNARRSKGLDDSAQNILLRKSLYKSTAAGCCFAKSWLMTSMEVRSITTGRPGLSRSTSVSAQQVSWMKRRIAMQVRKAFVLAILGVAVNIEKCVLRFGMKERSCAAVEKLLILVV